MSLSRRQLAAYAVLAVAVIAVGAKYVLASHPAGASTGEPLVLSSSLPSPAAMQQSVQPSPSPSVPDVVVYVVGAVRSPGIVRLAAVNLAARVADGQQIVVPRRGEAPVAAAPASSSAAAAAGTPAAPININTASLEELDALDGVGPSTAQKIIDYRTANGGFKTIDEIKEVPGIGDAKFAAMKDSITV